jgi:hypothetical protein
VEVVGRQPELEPLEYDGHRELGLQQRQVLPDAHPRTQPEGYERRRVLSGSCHAVGKPCRVELRGIRPPQLHVVVHGHDRDQQLRIPWDQAPAELHVGFGSPHRRHRRRVQSKRLVEDHPELPAAHASANNGTLLGFYMTRELCLEPRAYRLELGEVLTGGDVVRAADVESLLPGAVLPLGVHGEQDGGPRQEVGHRLLAGEEERLALLHDVVYGDGADLAAARLDHQAEEVLAAPMELLLIRGLLSSANERHQVLPDLLVQLPRARVLPGRQEPMQ